MGISGLLIFSAVGVMAGLLSCALIKEGGFGLFGNMVVGILGSIICGFLFGFSSASELGLAASIIVTTLGAALLLFIIIIIKFYFLSRLIEKMKVWIYNYLIT